METDRKQMKAAAIISLILSRSWMKTFYRDGLSSFTHAEALQQVKSVIEKLNQCVETDDLFEKNMDCFGDPIEYAILSEWKNTTTINKCERELVNKVLVVLKRQYSTYIGLSEEELSFLYKETGGAAILNLAAKIKSSKNKTMQYIMKVERDALIYKL